MGHRESGKGKLKSDLQLETLFSQLAGDVAARVAASASDLVLALDADGLIRDVSCAPDDLPATLSQAWLGLALARVVAADSRDKVAALLAEAHAEAPARWRQINFSTGSEQWPMRCTAVQVRADGAAVIFGRSLRGIVQLQQRLVEAQQAMEHDYWQFRQAETRYRQLFQASGEGVLVLDGAHFRVLEANPAAGQMLDRAEADLVGRLLPELFRDSTQVQNLLAGVRASGRPAELLAEPAGDHGRLRVAASAYRQGGVTQLLLRLTPRAGQPPGASLAESWAEMIRHSPDGLVLTDLEGTVLAANNAFVELAQLSAEEQLRGVSLDRWLGRSGVDLNVLVSNLRRRGRVRLFATTLRGSLGAVADVEIAAVQLDGPPPVLAFDVRDVALRLDGGAPGPLADLPRSADQLGELVGRMPLKDIVGETVDMIERMCIESALELTRGNRAAAAEMLGLSRQSLYVKLARHGLKGSGGDS